MLKIPGMLLIGAAGRNVGKTELACSLIRRYSETCDVIGIKVTTIVKKGGECPRGGEGCGVCSSLQGNYLITEEIEPPEEKDTARMLRAGASKVYWLRVMKTHLEEGLEALRKLLTPESVSVCESNSLRLAAEPDIFIVVRDKFSDKYKPSAAAVREYADRLLLFDGTGFDVDTDEFELLDGKWAIREQATAIVLAGGGSRRMGSDKSRLPLFGRSLVEHVIEQIRPRFQEILLSHNDVRRETPAGVVVVPDKARNQGPFMGIVSCLEASANDLNLVVACDMPEIDLDLVRRMLRAAGGYDGVVPVYGESLFEPLFAVYRKSVLWPASKLLASGERRIVNLYPHCNIRYLTGEFCGDNGMRNLNTPEEYQRFKDNNDGQSGDDGR